MGFIINSRLQKPKEVWVRECSEVEKGEYQAYVDEKEDSYDVFLKLNSKKEPTAHTCDCLKKVDFCRHKKALLDFIISPVKKSVKPEKVKKKTSTEILLSQMDGEDLKVWLTYIFKNNKELEINFTHHFKNQSKEYSPEEVFIITAEVVKAVAGKRRKLVPLEIKKIVDLWENVHKPVLEHYFTYINQEQAFLCFNALVKSSLEYDFQLITTSNRISKYIESLVLKAVLSLNQQKDDTVWATSISYFIQNLFFPDGGLCMPYLALINRILEEGDSERMRNLALNLYQSYLKRLKENAHSSSSYSFTVLVFDALEKTHQIEEYVSKFKPLPFQNLYNERLIRYLIQIRDWEKAEKYCLSQIEGNYQEVYDIPYLNMLKEIYVQTQNLKKQLEVLKILLPLNFCFKDYIMVESLSEDKEEVQKFRNKILAQARSSHSRGNEEVSRFPILLMDYEKKYKKMIDYLEYTTDPLLILAHADSMIKADKIPFLNKILNLNQQQQYYFGREHETFINFNQKIIGVIREHFTDTELSKFGQQYLFPRNAFEQNSLRNELFGKQKD